MATIKVTAGEGRSTPMHHTVATAPGGGLLTLVAPAEIEVDDSSYLVQRQLRCGDLVRVVEASDAKPQPTELADTKPAKLKATAKES